MSMSLSHCRGVLPHHHRKVERGRGRGGERGACHCHHQDEEEGEGVLSVVFVVVTCEEGKARRVRTRRE